MISLNKSVSVNEFRAKIKTYTDEVEERHEPLIVTRRNGSDFVIMSKEDFDAYFETMYVMNNPSLMKQIADSEKTYKKNKGIKKSVQELGID